MLAVDKQLEVQDQIFLYKKILEEISGFHISNNYHQLQTTGVNFDINQVEREKFVSDIDLIFLTELNTYIIKCFRNI